MNDVLRLAEYINQQCKVSRRSQAQKPRAAPPADRSNSKNASMADDNTMSLAASSTHNDVSILSTPPAVEKKGEKGFDRLLYKLLSPSAGSLPPSAVKSAPSQLCPTVRLEKVDEKNYSFTFGTPERTSRSLSLVRNDMSPTALNRMDLSSVGRTDEDDDDDEVFDLLHSVDDWASLRHFVRNGVAAIGGKENATATPEHLDASSQPSPSQPQLPPPPSSESITLKQSKPTEDPAAGADRPTLVHHDRGRLLFVPVPDDLSAISPIGWGLLGGHKKRQQTRSYSAPNKVDLRKSISLAIKRPQTPPT